MSNATAAGPSRGLLDAIFGSNSPETDEAGGQEFAPLMDFIKALNGKIGNEGGRTDEETAPDKDAIDYRVVGMSGLMPNLMAAVPAEATAPGSEMMGVTAQAGASAQPAGLLDPALVNRLLKEKSLPELTPEESKILTAVNQKMGASGAAKINPATLAPEMGENQAVQAAEKVLGAALVKELERRGVDPQQLRGQESSELVASPEKFFSTEAYLRMHEDFAKAGAKEENSPRMGKEEAAASAPVKHSESPETVAAPGEKGKDLFGRAHGKLEDLLQDGGNVRKPVVPGTLFAHELMHSLKDGGETREIVLPGTQPEQMRETLVGEVNQSVQFQAVKGGGEMRLVIFPESMGEVKLHVGTKDGKVEVQITAQNEDVAKTIRGGSKELESSLRDQNLALTKFDVAVSADSPLASTDTRSNLSDQFTQQQPSLNHSPNFGQGGLGSDRGFQSWSGQQDRSGAEFQANEQNTRNQPRESAARSSFQKSSGGSARRLDVVA